MGFRGGARLQLVHNYEVLEVFGKLGCGKKRPGLQSNPVQRDYYNQNIFK